MSTIWIPKKSGHDYSKAEKFGELRVICEEDVSPFNIDRVEEKVILSLKDATADDYVITVGPAIVNMMIMKNWPCNIMKILMFHAKLKDYVYREIYL